MLSLNISDAALSATLDRSRFFMSRSQDVPKKQHRLFPSVRPLLASWVTQSREWNS